MRESDATGRAEMSAAKNRMFSSTSEPDWMEVTYGAARSLLALILWRSANIRRIKNTPSTVEVGIEDFLSWVIVARESNFHIGKKKPASAIFRWTAKLVRWTASE